MSEEKFKNMHRESICLCKNVKANSSRSRSEIILSNLQTQL